MTDDWLEWDIGERAHLTESHPDAVGSICFVSQQCGSGTDIVEQIVGSLTVMALPCGQAQPDREALPIDDRIDFGGEPNPRATETMIWIPLFAVGACWWARTEVLSII